MSSKSVCDVVTFLGLCLLFFLHGDVWRHCDKCSGRIGIKVFGWGEKVCAIA